MLRASSYLQEQKNNNNKEQSIERQMRLFNDKLRLRHHHDDATL